MKPFTITIEARGSLLLGGGAVARGLHAASVQDNRGVPMIPATALRGALRESLEALLRGSGSVACDGGLGFDPDAAVAEGAVPERCELNSGKPCLACQLFGGGRPELPKGSSDFSALVLGDGLMDSTPEVPWVVRPAIGMARSSRSVADKLLALRRTTATRAVFTAHGWLRNTGQPLENEFKAAVAATTHLGAGRSRGLGRVTLTLNEGQPAAPFAPAYSQLSGDQVRLRLTLKTAAIFGSPQADANFRDTRREIPGATLRGAIGFAIANHMAGLKDANDRDALQLALNVLVDPTTGARFGFLSPVDGHPDPRVGPVGAVPLTSHACKAAGRKHGSYDVLLDRLLLNLAQTPTQAVKAMELARPLTCQHDSCEQPLRNHRGYRQRTQLVPVKPRTRVALHRPSSSAREKALFNELQVEAGTAFEGTIRDIPTGALDVLQTALSLPLVVGRSRGAGRGQVQVEILDSPSASDLLERATRFEDHLRPLLNKCELAESLAGRLVPLTLLSPCDLALGGSRDEDVALKDSLPDSLKNATLCLRARRFVREGSWDQRTGQMHSFQAVAAGGIYVLELPSGSHWRDALDALQELERQGLGQRTCQGFGEVLAFDPIHLQWGTRYAMTEPTEEPSETGEASIRKALVIAAEQVMEETYRNADGRSANRGPWRVEKSQLSHLIGVTGEAVCVEEIHNYLRYQASRERPSLGMDLVKAMISRVQPEIDKLGSDQEKVQRWRQYAVFLARAFTYRDAVSKEQARGRAR